jgi:hypothetical protein
MRQQPASSDQGSLFDTPTAPEVRRAMDPGIRLDSPHASLHAIPRDTEQTAAQAALPRSGMQRARVLEAIKGAGPAGMTDQEVATRLGLAENSVRPRRLKFADAGLIENSGERPATSGGNPAIVWRGT